MPAQPARKLSEIVTAARVICAAHRLRDWTHTDAAQIVKLMVESELSVPAFVRELGVDHKGTLMLSATTLYAWRRGKRSDKTTNWPELCSELGRLNLGLHDLRQPAAASTLPALEPKPETAPVVHVLAEVRREPGAASLYVGEVFGGIKSQGGTLGGALVMLGMGTAEDQAESDRLARLACETAGWLSVGVGDGTGQRFVYGDHDSIKSAQAKLIAGGQARAELADAQARVRSLEDDRTAYRSALRAMLPTLVAGAVAQDNDSGLRLALADHLAGFARAFGNCAIRDLPYVRDWGSCTVSGHTVYGPREITHKLAALTERCMGFGSTDTLRVYGEAATLDKVGARVHGVIDRMQRAEDAAATARDRVALAERELASVREQLGKANAELARQREIAGREASKALHYSTALSAICENLGTVVKLGEAVRS